MPGVHWFGVTAVSSIVASVFVVIFMSPFDVAATRVYNQPVDPKVSFKSIIVVLLTPFFDVEDF